MKKYIIGITLGVAFLVAPIAQAATIDEVQTLQTEYHNTLITLIGLLTKQVEALVAQLAIVQSNQTVQAQQTADVAKQVTEVQQNTTPVFGGVTSNPTPVVPVDVPTMMVIHSEKSIDVTSYPHGWYTFTVSVLDQNGKEMKQPIHMQNPNDNLFKSSPGDFDGQSLFNGGGSGFQYMPSTIGEKTVTFTSGNLSTTTSFTVQ